MNTEMMTRLTENLSESPILRAATLPNSTEIDAASHELGVPFSSDYREFLHMFGGAMVGPYPIYGLRPVEVMGDDEWSVVTMTKRHREGSLPGTEAWVIISSDHSGNPVGMDGDGMIWIHDHDFGGITPLAKSFEEYVRVWCLRLKAD